MRRWRIKARISIKGLLPFCKTAAGVFILEEKKRALFTRLISPVGHANALIIPFQFESGILGHLFLFTITCIILIIELCPII